LPKTLFVYFTFFTFFTFYIHFDIEKLQYLKIYYISLLNHQSMIGY